MALPAILHCMQCDKEYLHGPDDSPPPGLCDDCCARRDQQHPDTSPLVLATLTMMGPAPLPDEDPDVCAYLCGNLASHEHDPYCSAECAALAASENQEDGFE